MNVKPVSVQLTTVVTVKNLKKNAIQNLQTNVIVKTKLLHLFFILIFNPIKQTIDKSIWV